MGASWLTRISIKILKKMIMKTKKAFGKPLTNTTQPYPLSTWQRSGIQIVLNYKMALAKYRKGKWNKKDLIPALPSPRPGVNGWTRGRFCLCVCFRASTSRSWHLPNGMSQLVLFYLTLAAWDLYSTWECVTHKHTSTPWPLYLINLFCFHPQTAGQKWMQQP